ncbi:hypothetical protein ACO1O0_006900 [Amphichorda felina]
MASRVLKALLLGLLPAAAVAKTDLDDCTTIEGTYTPSWSGADPWRTRFYYDPDTFEECSFLDCGGGRAPPKKTVPGCGEYTGTATYSPMYIELVTVTTDGMPSTVTEGVLRSGPPPGVTITEATATSSSSAAAETESESESEDESSTAAETNTSSAGGSEGQGKGDDAAKPTTTDESQPSTTPTGAAAAPTVGAVLGGCLVAGAGIMAMI